MTDKMIVDGVDVSGCIHLDEWKHCDICQELIKTIDGANGKKRSQCLTTKDLECAYYPNCYYKQLQRKEKECEELCKANDEKNEFLQKLGISASGEFKRIKYYIDKLNAQYTAIVEQNKSLQQELQAEKENSKHLDDLLNQALKDFEIEQLKVEKLKNELAVYKEILEEIKKIIKKEIVCDECNFQDTDKCDSRLCTNFYLDDFCKGLLQKFEVLND